MIMTTNPRTSAFCAMSLDGYLARSDGSIDWLKPFEGAERGFLGFFASIDTLVMGRRTYEFVLEMLAAGMPWPYSGKRVVVMTHRPLDGRNDARPFAGEPRALLQELRAQGAEHVYVDGGVVIRDFLAAGLLDEMTISVIPCLLGTGFPLFGGVKRESGLKLERVTTFDRGFVTLHYRVDDAS
jgi:dihydrofolate reductase